MHLEKNPSEVNLLQGIAALKAGRKSDAERLLKQAARQSPRDAETWLWLGAAVSSPAETLYCLERVLQLEPDNQKAQSGIRWVRDQHAPAELAALNPLTDDQGVSSPAPGTLLGDSTFVVDNVQDGINVVSGQTVVETTSGQPASVALQSKSGNFFPNLIIVGLCLTLLLGILIIIALLRTWLG